MSRDSPISRHTTRVGIGAILLLWFFWPYLVLGYLKLTGLGGSAEAGATTDLARFGQLGDSYGALTSLFTAAAFLGVVASFYYLRKQTDAAQDAATQASIQADEARKQTQIAQNNAEAERAERTVRQGAQLVDRVVDLLPSLQNNISGYHYNNKSGLPAFKDRARDVMRS